MKNSSIKILVLFVLTGVCLWLLLSHKQPNAFVSSSDSAGTTPPARSVASNIPAQEQFKPVANSGENTNDAYISSLSESDFYKLGRIDRKLEWKMPINFWGKVVDESNVPVLGATVNFEWNVIANAMFQNGTDHAGTQSDGKGLFSLISRRGKRLYVDVSKEGYYSSGDARNATFEYAQPEIRFHPDKNNPVVFHLRKKGEGTDLITSAQGMSGYFQVHISRDGTPAPVDLLHHQQGNGQLELSEIKPEHTNWQHATQWSFKAEIHDGGLIGQNDEFPFQAPESGYQPVVSVEFQKDNNWATNTTSST